MLPLPPVRSGDAYPLNVQGLLKVGPKQQGKSSLRMGIKPAHLSGQIRDVQRIGHREHGIVERSQHLRGLARAHLAGIFSQRDIAPPMQTIFDLPMRPIEL